MKLDIQDKFLQRDGRVFLTGMEAIVRLVREKQERDQATGHVNQTYFTGYEGSPLGGLDLKIVAQLEMLNELGRTVHQFGINEKTAASAILGSQFAASGDIDAFWYGKAHGTMWIPDEVWLANLSGTGARGAMVLLSGEDHRSKSSVSPGASDWVLRSSMVPIFYPASIEDVIRLGLHAVALSRHAGVVTALKLATPVCDGASTVDLAGVRPDIALPERAFAKRFNQIVMATGALPMQQQLVEEKWPLVEAYVRANDLNRIVDADAGGGVGIVAVGKSYADVRQALSYLGLRVPVLFLAVSYPLDCEIVRTFARGLRHIYVVEEPGPFVEEGVKAALWGTDVEAVYGQWDEDGQPLIPAHGEVDPEELALKLGPRLGRLPSASPSCSACSTAPIRPCPASRPCPAAAVRTTPSATCMKSRGEPSAAPPSGRLKPTIPASSTSPRWGLVGPFTAAGHPSTTISTSTNTWATAAISTAVEARSKAASKAR